MKFLSTLLFISVSCLSFGQTSLIGIRFGLNRTNVSFDDFFNDSKPKNGFIGGANYEYVLDNNIFFQAELNYNQRGFLVPLTYTNSQGEIIGEHDATFSYNYISLPIKSGVYFGQKVQGFGSVGVVPSYLVKAELITPTMDSNGQFIGEESEDITDLPDSFDLAGLIEVGINYKMTDQYWLSGACTYQYSFTSLTNSEYFSSTDANHTGFTFSFGLKYRLSK